MVGAIYGLAPATTGEILVNGRNIRVKNPAAALAAGIALVTEDRKEFGLVPRMSVKHNLHAGQPRRLRHRSSRGKLPSWTNKFRCSAIKVSSRNQLVLNLSGGNQQKIVIAKALLTQPEILILDEPTRGIDIGAKAEVYAIINRLAVPARRSC